MQAYPVQGLMAGNYFSLDARFEQSRRLQSTLATSYDDYLLAFEFS